MKPLTSLNSCVTLPPCSEMCFFALSYMSYMLEYNDASCNLLFELIGGSTVLEGNLDEIRQS